MPVVVRQPVLHSDLTLITRNENDFSGARELIRYVDVHLNEISTRIHDLWENPGEKTSLFPRRNKIVPLFTPRYRPRFF